MKAIDLFAGIGGIRLGFQQAFKNELEVVFSSEIDNFAVKSYKANFNNEDIYGDIKKIKIKDIPKFDLLMAGFPCQAFSRAGNKKGFLDPRGTLFFEIAKILKVHKPEIIFLENVKNLINHDKKNTFKTILHILENELNYKVYYKILNSKDFGLPQNRERIYIVCFKNHNIDFKFPELLNIPTKLGNILEPYVDPRYTISDKIWAGHQRRKLNNKKNKKGFGYRLFDENSEYVSTLLANYCKANESILIKQEGKNPRCLTPLEASRLQGFPEDFKIVVSKTQAYKQFGNSVSIPVIFHIAKEIKKSLKNSENNNLL